MGYRRRILVSRSPRRRGFSMAEVMIALLLVAIATTALLGTIANIRGVREQTKVNVQAQSITRQLVDRFSSAQYEDLNKTNTKWSYPRIENVDPAMTAQDLIDWNVVSKTELDAQFSFFVEYYRARSVRRADGTADPTQPGLLDANLKTPSQWDAYWKANKGLCRLPFTQGTGIVSTGDSTRAVADGDPVMVRIVIRKLLTAPGMTPAYSSEEVWAGIGRISPD